MLYDIVCFGKEELRSKAKPVEGVDESIKTLAADMLATMRAASGLGLAAEQIGRTEAICVIDVTPDREMRAADGQEDPDADIDMPLVLINPDVVSGSGEIRAQEGCLSFPEIYAAIPRYAECECAYTDLNGERKTLKAHGMLARAIQHEVDHLNAVLMVDRMTVVQRMAVAGKLKRLKRAAKARHVV